MTTNVPYVAWAGEEVRLVKCIDDEEGDWEGTDAEWAIVDSSVRQQGGDLRDPVFFDDTDRRTGDFAGGGEQEDRTCWAIDVESVHPGMTRIKMAVDANEGTPGSPVLKHDFLVIWLGMSNPLLTELGESAFPGIDLGDQDGGSPASFTPRDIDGDGDLEFGPGLIRVTVTGSFVDLRGSARTLPADWAALAGRYAFDTDLSPNPSRWDIHDDQSLEEIHSAASFCLPPKAGAIDGVDNCLGLNGPTSNAPFRGETGPFSRTIGGTFMTVGPFDPARPGSSFLPNGRLDKDDAPMPAARIDLSLSGGVGALAAADKHEIYSRDRLGSVDDPSTLAVENAHNLYAPFYLSLIPADASQANPDYTTSGTTGPVSNNFPGYQTIGFGGGDVRAYHFWDFLKEHRRSGVNDCFDVGGDGQFGNGAGPVALPTGVDEATVYTDEHGEALAWFLPDVGVDFDFRTDADEQQGICDLGDSPDAELLGTATITAEAMDPYQPTFSDVRAGNALVKDVNELAFKSLDCFPKTNLIAVCIETIVDIWGNPVEGAVVIFTADSPVGDPNVIGMSGPFGAFAGSSCPISPAGSLGLVEGTVCYTNANGQAGVEILASNIGNVNVIAENYRTRNHGFGILRDRCIHYNSSSGPLPTDGPSCANTNEAGPVLPPTPPGDDDDDDDNGSVIPLIVAQGNTAPAVIVSLAGNPVPATAPTAKLAAKPAAKAVATKLAAARFVFVNGKRFLVIRANGSAKTAKVRITLVMRTGQVMKPVVRTIRTNKAVRVANLQISKHVRTVRVSLAK